MKNSIVDIMFYSRYFSLPMTILSWLVIFTYSIINTGDVGYGIVALIGLCFAHLGTNILDDYFDYKSLIKQVGFSKEEYLKNSQKTKCRYIISGRIKPRQALFIALTHFSIAGFCGLFLFLKCGIGVIYFALIGGIIAVFYSLMSRICLSEFAVALAYGPALFGGVYYVMTNSYDQNIIYLSIPTMIMTVILLYIHTVMDYEFDILEGKCTLANRFESPLKSLVVLKGLIITAYLSLPLLCVLDILDWQVFLAYLTIPLAIDLYKSMKEFALNPESLPSKKWYHFPMENLEKLKANNEASFMIRMYQSRNLMIYFALFMVVAIILALAI